MYFADTLSFLVFEKQNLLYTQNLAPSAFSKTHPEQPLVERTIFIFTPPISIMLPTGELSCFIFLCCVDLSKARAD